MRADAHRFALPEPGDVSGLRRAIKAGEIDPASIVAVIGKTHGNGLVNDFTRGYLALSLSLLIGEHLGEAADAVRRRVPFIVSGGVEGVLSPHYAVFTVTADGMPDLGGAALAISVGVTAPMRPAEIGRQAQIDAVAHAVSEARRTAGIEEVHFVQVKGPAFSAAEIRAERAGSVAAEHPGKLMAFGRAACALGVAKALGEVAETSAVEAAVLQDFSRYSSVASVSAGVEVRSNEVVVLGMSSGWSGTLAIAHEILADPLDVAGMHRVLQRLEFPAAPQVADAGRIRAGFVKCQAPRDGLVRGRAHTMLDDGDIDEQRHIRAAVGAVAASVLNDTALFVSGGAEHQGPDGGGLVAVVAERPRLEESTP